MDLNALADFIAVAQRGGFGPAARATGRPKATLSRRVAELEQQLGVRLIERGARTTRLTEEGRALFERTSGLLAEIDEAGDDIASRAPTPRGRLRVSAPMVYAHVVLARAAASFALAYPQVELEVVAEDRIVDPLQDDYDLVIRVNPSPDELLIGRAIATDRRVLVATPALAESLANTLSNAAPSLPTVVLARASHPAWTVRLSDGSERTVTPQPMLRLSSLLMVREAVLDGAAAGLLPHLLVESDIAAKRLTMIGCEAGPGVEIWALYSSRRLLSAKVRAFLNVLVSAEPGS